jgi:hypothetical protein
MGQVVQLPQGVGSQGAAEFATNEYLKLKK